SWHPNWPLQEVDVQLLGIGTLFQVKQGSEGQRERLRSYVANIAVNLWGCDLLQQWYNQINIPAVPEIHVTYKEVLLEKCRLIYCGLSFTFD
ncbi:hypothetical protein U0070_014512, partial [Myodes glareolus]